MFGLMMQVMMGRIGSLIGADRARVAIAPGVERHHRAIFGLTLGSRVGNRGAGIGLGAAYGFVWWILGPLLLMPTRMGMGPMCAMALDTYLIDRGVATDRRTRQKVQRTAVQRSRGELRSDGYLKRRPSVAAVASLGSIDAEIAYCLGDGTTAGWNDPRPYVVKLYRRASQIASTRSAAACSKVMTIAGVRKLAFCVLW